MALLSKAAFMRVEEMILARRPEYLRAGGVQVPSAIREAAMNRKRQKRWRKKNRQVWVTR